jgi:TATA-binding protein-associated factor Taf7
MALKKSVTSITDPDLKSNFQDEIQKLEKELSAMKSSSKN